jgi:hypothetical protein
MVTQNARGLRGVQEVFVVKCFTQSSPFETWQKQLTGRFSSYDAKDAKNRKAEELSPKMRRASAG